MGARVLVVDDEPDIRRVVRAGLQTRGYTVEVAAGGAEALDRISRQWPDVVLLDLMMPGIDGLEVIRQARGWSRVPIIVLSVREEELAKVRALDLGADDYVTKPFGMDELVARIRVALRHTGGTEAAAPVIRVGKLTIDLEHRRVTTGEREVALTPTEYNILRALAEHAGKVLTHGMLIREIWGPDYGGTEDHYLHVYIARLRRKLEPDPTSPHYLITEPGAGYRLRAE